MLEQSREIALEAHATQRDKLGRDYFDAHLRPIAEAAAVFGPEAAAAGWLHDVIEDTPSPLTTCASGGSWSPSSKPSSPCQGEGRRALRGAHLPRLPTRSVAWSSLSTTRGTSPATLPWPEDPDKASDLMARKYVPARARLLAACGFDADSPEVRQIQAILDSHLARLHAKG